MPIVRNGTDETGDPLFEVTDILQLEVSKRIFLPDVTLLSFYFLLSSRSARLAYHLKSHKIIVITFILHTVTTWAKLKTTHHETNS